MRSGSKTLERGLQALRALADFPDQLGPRELARRLAITRSAAQRILNSLTAHGFAQQNASSRHYRLGHAIRGLAESLERKDELVSVARQPMVDLSAIADETVCLHTREDRWRVPILQIRCENELRYNVKLGARYPLNAGAAGRALLAFLPLDEVRRLGKSFEWRRRTSETARNWKEFEQRLEDTRRNGFAVSRGESTPGVCGIAAPVFDMSGAVVASIGIHAPKVRVSENRIAALAPHVVRAAAQVSRALGHHGGRAAPRAVSRKTSDDGGGGRRVHARLAQSAASRGFQIGEPR